MDEAYLIGRMRASLAMSRNAVGSAARLIHLDLAGRYSVAAQRVAESLIFRRPRYGRCETSFYCNDSQIGALATG